MKPNVVKNSKTADKINEELEKIPNWETMTKEEKDKAFFKGLFNQLSPEWRKKFELNFLTWKVMDQKTEQIAFRCSLKTRRLIEMIANEAGMNISQTMEFMIDCFFAGSDPEK